MLRTSRPLLTNTGPAAHSIAVAMPVLVEPAQTHGMGKDGRMWGRVSSLGGSTGRRLGERRLRSCQMLVRRPVNA